jgi:hypothetical protein
MRKESDKNRGVCPKERAGREKLERKSKGEAEKGEKKNTQPQLRRTAGVKKDC